MARAFLFNNLSFARRFPKHLEYTPHCKSFPSPLKKANGIDSKTLSMNVSNTKTGTQHLVMSDLSTIPTFTSTIPTFNHLNMSLGTKLEPLGNNLTLDLSLTIPGKNKPLQPQINTINSTIQYQQDHRNHNNNP